MIKSQYEEYNEYSRRNGQYQIQRHKYTVLIETSIAYYVLFHYAKL